MLDWFLLFAIAHFIMGLRYLLHLQTKRHLHQQEKKEEESVEPVESVQPPRFVPMEDRIVPTHASYSNKFNDVIGNETSGIVGEGVREVVVPSDWYMSRTLPTEFDGPYWPNGGIQPDFLYPGSDPARPLRNQAWPAAFSISKGD